MISALTVLANGVGNVIAGMLLKRGVALWAITLFGYVVIGVSGFAIFAPGLPVLAIAIVTAVTLALTGFIPASHCSPPRRALRQAPLCSRSPSASS